MRINESETGLMEINIAMKRGRWRSNKRYIDWIKSDMRMTNVSKRKKGIDPYISARQGWSTPRCWEYKAKKKILFKHFYGYLVVLLNPA